MAKNDRAATTQRIFDAAVIEFAAHGIAGARVDRIAEKAKSNKAQIYNYFGSKEKLFGAVLRSRFADLNNAFELSPDRVSEFTGDIFDFLTNNPDVVRLLMQESFRLARGPFPHQVGRGEEFDAEAQQVRLAQAAGLVDHQLDPGFAVFTMMSLVCWFVAVPQISGLMAGDLPADEFRARYRAHVIKVADRMLDPR